ncbi:hypothetical protein M8J77_011199 [Diaphorina citri]|nr:hypothetical protein M8J77_011199 [Diaphorina citri]
MNNFLGNIEQFNEEDMDWPSYVERLELFLECNGIAEDEAKKVKMALTLMGGKVFAVAKDVCFPGKPQEEKWEDLKIEQTEKDLREETNVQDVNKLQEQRFFKSRPHHIGPTRNFPSSSKMTPSSSQGCDDRSDMHCVCCGRNGHMIRNCRFRYYKCHVCGNQGHLKNMCKEGQNQRQHFVSEMEMHQEEEDDETLSYLLSIENQLNYVDKFQLERHPIPRIEELLIGIKTGGKFTILDLSHAYQQMELDDEAKELVAISTHKGVYFYNRMPFGISPAPGIFQKRISEELRDIENVKVYFDEILIFGDNQNTHFEALCKVLDKLKVMGLTVSQDKCKFFQDQTKFLGYVIDKNGIRPSQEKTQAIVYAPEPENVKQLQSFLGLVNYYRKFLPDLSSIQKPLNDLLCKGAEFKFDETCKQSFNKIKELLSQDNALLHFDTNKRIILACDASAYGISAVLLQHDENGNEKPVAFASRRLNKAEENYSQVDKEALSIIFGVKKFDQHLWGQKFKIRSDCKALVSIFGSKHGFPQMAASRLQRYAVFLSGYNFAIEYITSEKNVLADALSRLPLHTSNEGCNSANYLKFICENNVLDTKKIQSETDKDKILSKIKTYVLSGWPDKSLMSEIEMKYYNKKEELTIEDVWKRHVDQMMKFKGEKSLNIGGETQGQSYVYLNTNVEDVPVSSDSENEQNGDTYVASEPDTEELGDDESSVSTEETTIRPMFYGPCALYFPQLAARRGDSTLNAPDSNRSLKLSNALHGRYPDG